MCERTTTAVALSAKVNSSKTNTVALLIKELVRHGKPMMIFDWKRNYRDLLHGPNPVPLEVYTVGRSVRPLRFNPLIPPPETDIKIRNSSGIAASKNIPMQNIPNAAAVITAEASEN